MSKKSLLMCLLTILLIVYSGYALHLTNCMARTEHVRAMKVTLSDPNSRFVSVADVIVESGIDPDTISRCYRYNFPLGDIEHRLEASDKLQSANVSLSTDGVVHIDVVPMVPVARVFDANKPSYYINAKGKSISAELRYHIDVPILVGTFDSVHPAHHLLPLLERITNDPGKSAMVSTVTQEPNGNIILIPTIVGHVINFGDTTMVDDKFHRLRAFYRHVAPTKGWEMYDTIAVKWRDRIVATRRNKALKPITIPTEDEASGNLDIDNNELMPDDSISSITTD